MKVITTPLKYQIEYEIKYSIENIEKTFIYHTYTEIIIEDLINDIINELVYQTCGLEKFDSDVRLKIILTNYFKRNIKIIGFKATKNIKRIKTKDDDPNWAVDE